MSGKKIKSHELLRQIFEKRNLMTDYDIEKFTNPNFLDFRNPFDFENMDKIIDKIIKADKEGGKIFIYGDYDVDGISGTAFLVRFLRDINYNVDYYIPNRTESEYGVSRKNIDFFYKKNGKLIITVDTGYNSIEDVKYARSLGMDIIVTDHHKTVKESFDDEILYLNPKLSKNYKFKNLSGAGVAFKLAQGICIRLNLDMDLIYKYLDIVMIGTIADVVPMIDENRIIIKNGLKIIKNTNIKGLSYLLNYLRLNKKEMTTTDVSYYISPLINSLGRVGISKVGADFFIKEDDFDLYNIIEDMKTLNKERRSLEKIIYDDAMKKIQRIGLDRDETPILILSSPKWHSGVIGVVSSRLSLKYHKPVILIAFEGDYGKASCRSVANISIFNLLSEVKHLLVRYGGHDLAAGFVIHKSKLTDLKDYLIKNTPLIKSNDELEIKNCEEEAIKYDFEVSIDEIDSEIFKFIDLMGPFGSHNPHILFYSKNVKFRNLKTFGIDFRHFNGEIIKNHVKYNTVGFDMSEKIEEKKYEDRVYDIVYYPEKIVLKDEEVIQIVLKDIIKKI
ncbi:MAG: single-stranded-DNA-specific exonuclease RecJ [Fusobacterium sp.]|uniref:single-stranded-DNA-specific exonuclease RecJ n=1 Tax=Fusobacterium sp. TaxID=68766 RepID=UPI0026DC3495|nr:single-stranded-DNA-specific exonuclease RecJ [Fusobacterium sp.]MDO4689733.1 single-stranded-DNA-specific exonuclease RecJ [Fusobacterium sp.]